MGLSLVLLDGHSEEKRNRRYLSLPIHHRYTISFTFSRCIGGFTDRVIITLDCWWRAKTKKGEQRVPLSCEDGCLLPP